MRFRSALVWIIRSELRHRGRETGQSESEIARQLIVELATEAHALWQLVGQPSIPAGTAAPTLAARIANFITRRAA